MSTLAALASLLLGLGLPQGTGDDQDARANERPNIVLIVTDDLGYGDLGCYGQETLATPNVDRLAAGGRRYTQFYAGSTVCAPSRCVLMTGRHTGRALIRGNSDQSLRDEDVTLAEVLRAAGYRTGCFGKWGLGDEGSEGLPTRQGFDSFFGYLDQRHAHNYYPTFLIRDEQRVPLTNVVPNEGDRGQGHASEKHQYSHDLIVDAAFEFLGEAGDDPFFLYLPWTLPHANNEAGAAGMETPGLGPFAAEDWPAPERGFAAMLALIDRDVGRILDYLEARGLRENTLVMFTSDNGPHHEGGHTVEFFDSNGALRGSKRDLTEGGIRVPFLASWPGRVPANTTSDHLSAFWDLLPTLAELGGAAPAQLPAEVDGISMARDLLGQADQPRHASLYWAFYERGGAQALRRGRWKAVQQPYDSPIRLYDLDTDPGETRDLAPENAALVAELAQDMHTAYTPSRRWRFPKAKNARWTPEVPRLWDEERIATLELPPPHAGVSPEHVSAEYYYSIPVRPVYRSYPAYHPDHEPDGYWDWLAEQEPEVVFDPAALVTKQDWIRAGELIFTEGNEYATDTELSFLRDARGWEAAKIPKAKDNLWPYGRYFVREKGLVELGTDSCASCHTRVMPDGSLLFGGAGDFPLGWTIAYELRKEAAEADEPVTVDESWFDYRAYAAPWIEPDPGALVLGLTMNELARVVETIPPGVIARKRTSYLTPTRVPSLIGVRDRRYLDASGLVQQREIGDLMRYAALNQGADGLSSFGGFRPETEDGRSLPDPATLTRYSDEALYALALYLESLEQPVNPSPPEGGAARRGARVFQSERCFKCHPAPLYTNNELMPVLDFEPTDEDRERFAVMGRRMDTDPGLTLGTRRGTGYYKVPSLRGLWARGPFFHDGSLDTLEDVFDPRRLGDDYVPTGFRPFGVERQPVLGHEYGLDLDQEERADLVSFLRSL